jgi:hypothetical protein
MKTYALNVVEESGTRSVRQVHLEDSESEVLSRFREDAEKLWGTKWVRDEFNSGMKLNYSSGVTTAEVRLPPDEDIAAFLHYLRPFQLKKEPTYYEKACKVLARRIEDDGVRSALKTERAGFLGEHFNQGLMQVSSNGVVINCEATLNKWLNAYEYHRDQDKKREIEDLHTFFPMEASKVMFLRLLRDKAIAIKRLADFIDLLFNGNGEIEIHTPSGVKKAARPE